MKDFWNYCKLYFRNKCICIDEPIILVENVKILRKNTKICKTYNDYFVDNADKWDIYNWGEDASYYSTLTSRMIVSNNHPGIRLIKDKYQQSFDFKIRVCIHKSSEIDRNTISGGDIPAKGIKMVKEELAVPITNCINKWFHQTIFWMKLKLLTLS